MPKAPNPRNPLQKRIKELSEPAAKSTLIKQEYYDQYDCKRGLRDINGKGVLVGLTEISEIIAAKEDENGNRIPVDGELYYRGIPIEDIVKGFVKEYLCRKTATPTDVANLYSTINIVLCHSFSHRNHLLYVFRSNTGYEAVIRSY